MHPSARSGYVWLLLDAWQTDDCTIPSDPIDLADKSGLGDELWAAHGIRILRKFEQVNGSDRLRNLPQYERWQAAKAVYEKRQESANRTNELRSPSIRRSVTDTITSQSPSIPNLPLEPPLTETERGTERIKAKKQKPSRSEDVKAPDIRHTSCKDEIFAYYRSKNNGEDPDWNGREGKALGILLSGNPKLTAIGMRKLLESRFDSDVNHSERPSIWLNYIANYRNGPIDRYGKPKISNGGNHAAVPSGKTAGNLAVLAESLNRGKHQGTPSEDGLFPAGKTGNGDVGIIHGVFAPVGPSRIPSSNGDDF
jgi:hypothetical protein